VVGRVALEARGLEKSFGATRALRGVDFTAREGEIVALIGENGAGKSTLMGILSGALRADAGTMTLGEQEFRPSSPREARAAGVVLVHQELSLCEHLTVSENVTLGIEPAKFGFVDRKLVDGIAARALKSVVGEGGGIALDARVSELSPANRQLVEIARAVAQPGCRVLLLDEPTSSLAHEDVERLFSLLRALSQKSLSIVYISHFLEELLRVAHRYTLLRDGAVVENGDVAGTDTRKLVTAMSGAEPAEAERREESASAREPLLVLSGDHELSVARGEIVGIAGLVGSGRTELLRAIFGLDPVKRGAVRVASYTGAGSPRARIQQGVGFLSEDRKGEGLALPLSIADNMTLSRLEGLGIPGFVSDVRQAAAAQTWVDTLRIRCRDVRQPVRDLSGGNQQKVALSRLLHQRADLFLLDEPYRGVDVNSKAQIAREIVRLANEGKAILLVSSHLPDLLALCDRIAVMHKGRLQKARPASSFTEHELLVLATSGEENAS
jgi:ribose transport system ATP-binding protein